jgi:ATP/maltotriose-dependent transcriptional regulator MalT
VTVRRLDVSLGTVRKHLEHVSRTLGVQDRLSAIDRWRELGLLRTEVLEVAVRRGR